MSAFAANLLAAPKREALAGSGDEFQLRAELSSSVFAARLRNRDSADVSCAIAWVQRLALPVSSLGTIQGPQRRALRPFSCFLATRDS